jgi:hypothetical protein
LPVTADALRAHEPRHKTYLASRLPHLELCALFDTLIADADSVYNPLDLNDCLLLCMN